MPCCHFVKSNPSSWQTRETCNPAKLSCLVVLTGPFWLSSQLEATQWQCWNFTLVTRYGYWSSVIFIVLWFYLYCPYVCIYFGKFLLYCISILLVRWYFILGDFPRIPLTFSLLYLSTWYSHFRPHLAPNSPTAMYSFFLS